MRPKRRAPRSRKVALIALFLVLVLALDYLAFPYGAAPPRPADIPPTNGLWVRYPFYFGQRTPEELTALCQRLRTAGIRDAFFHVRSAKRDGTLVYHYPEAAQRLVAQVHRQAPQVRAIAWFSVEHQTVRLADPKVRQKLVKEAVWLCRMAGFAGVQWDYELCQDGNPYLLALLQETRAALPKGAFLGVAAPVWSPLSRALGWSADYFTKVAAHCDQVAIMCYDTGMFLPRAYVALTAGNVVEVTRAVARDFHHPHSENLANALLGAQQGRAALGEARASFAGVALFADYTTEPSEWETYARLWYAAPP